MLGRTLSQHTHRLGDHSLSNLASMPMKPQDDLESLFSCELTNDVVHDVPHEGGLSHMAQQV